MKKFGIVMFILMMVFTLAACGSNSSNNGGNATNNEPNTSGNTNGTEDKEPMVLGASLALTGGFAFAGSVMKESMELLTEQVNAEGGINGQPLEIIYYDDENKPENAVRNANKLIKSDNVEIIIGPSVGSTSAAIQPIADKEKVIMFSLSAAYVGPPDSYGFASSYGQDAMHDLIHQYALKEGIDKVGMIATNDVSGDISVEMVEALQGKDGITYYIERMGVSDVDVTPQLTKLSNEGIGILNVIGPGSAAGVAIQNAGKLNMNMPIIATHSQLSDVFAKSIKDFIPDQMFVTGPPVMAYDELPDSNVFKPKLAAFAEAFQAKYGKNPDYMAAIGYDSLAIIIEGLKKVGNDADKMKEFLQNDVKDFVGVHAIFNMTTEDHRGTTSQGVTLLKLDPDLSWHIEWAPEF